MGKYNFNVGDKLRVVEGSGTFNVGDIVTCDRNINSNEDNCIDVILSNGNKSTSWLASRFKLVEENSSLKGKFNVGDRVRRIESQRSDSWETSLDKISVPLDRIFIVKSINKDYSPQGIILEDIEGTGSWQSTFFELVEETPSNVCKMTKKTIYNVLIVDKKTGKATKDEKVTAGNEQQAILKTFGVDAENTFIKITELGSYEEDKPIKAVIEEKPKK